MLIVRFWVAVSYVLSAAPFLAVFWLQFYDNYSALAVLIHVHRPISDALAYFYSICVSAFMHISLFVFPLRCLG